MQEEPEFICVDIAQEGADTTALFLVHPNEQEGRAVSARALIMQARQLGKTNTQYAYFEYLQELIAKGEMVIIDDLETIEIKNYAADLEPCQPSSSDWFGDRRHSKCKKHRREARGWR